MLRCTLKMVTHAHKYLFTLSLTIIDSGKFKEFTQGKHVKTMSIFYLPEVKRQILVLCDTKSNENNGINPNKPAEKA